MSDKERPMPRLVFKCSRSGRLAATALPAKGATEFGVKWFARQIQSTGVRSVINHSDGEDALKGLKEAAARLVPGVEAKPREVPVGDGFSGMGLSHQDRKRQSRPLLVETVAGECFRYLRGRHS